MFNRSFWCYAREIDSEAVIAQLVEKYEENDKWSCVVLYKCAERAVEVTRWGRQCKKKVTKSYRNLVEIMCENAPPPRVRTSKNTCPLITAGERRTNIVTGRRSV